MFSLPPGTQMFHFPGFPLTALCVQAGATRHDPCRVFPFGDPRIGACLAAPRGLSQPATSFIGFQRLGIHRVPFATCRDDARARYGVLNDPPAPQTPARTSRTVHPRTPTDPDPSQPPPTPTGSRRRPTRPDQLRKTRLARPSKLHSVPAQTTPPPQPVTTASGPPSREKQRQPDE